MDVLSYDGEPLNQARRIGADYCTTRWDGGDYIPKGGNVLAAALSAVEEGPFKVLKVIDGDTIEVLYSPHPERSSVEPKPTRVRLLYVDTPEGTDNDHGKAMPEGQKAKEFLAKEVGSEAYLYSPKETIERDRYGRLLAIVYSSPKGALARQDDQTSSLNERIIRAGWSPFWRKYGSPGELHELRFNLEHNRAKLAEVGAWATAPDWMRDKANERTAPKK